MSGQRNSRTRWAVGAITVGAMFVGSVAPAMARHKDYGGGYYGGRYGYGYDYPYRYDRYRHHRHRGGLDAGDVIGIALLAGAVAIVASSVNKDKKSRDRDRDPDWHDNERSREGRDDYRDTADEDDAVDACVSAARDEAESQSGGYAEIIDVESPRRSSKGGWDVEGRLEQRSSYRDNELVTKSFSCSYERGRVAHVYVSHNLT